MSLTHNDHTFWFFCLFAIALAIALSNRQPLEVAHSQAGDEQTVITTGYQPPIGIPAPSFGIEEVAPQQPAAWPSAEVAGYYILH